MKALIWAYEHHSNKTYVVLFEDRSGLVVGIDSEQHSRIRAAHPDLLNSYAERIMYPDDSAPLIIEPFVTDDTVDLLAVKDDWFTGSRLGSRSATILRLVDLCATRHQQATIR